MSKLSFSYDVAVIGGGMTGICAAIASARLGAKTVLLQDRPVFGGNASSEIRMHIAGATRHGHCANLRETGIIEEILLENKYRNPEHSYGIFDTILWEKVKFQENLDFFLNTFIDNVEMQDGKIISVSGSQNTTGKSVKITAKQFIDCSGDGLVSLLSGTDYMFGREGKDVFGEKYAFEKSDNVTMGNTIQFRTLKADRPVPFKRPDWAYDYTNSDWAKREKWEEITSGYWWLEIGGVEFDCLENADDTRDELIKIIYGVWDYIKNHCYKKEEAENYYLDWVGFVPAKREGKRFIGDYILTENDILANRIFDDSVAYGGWVIDDHYPEAFQRRFKKYEEPIPQSANFSGAYGIPYRSLYSKNVDNLFLGGRLISASHRALSSTRVMSICAVIGEAIGVSAALAVRDNLTVRENIKNIKEIQQLLLRNGCYIPNVKNEDPLDLAQKATVISDFGIPQNVINGISRPEGDNSNMWEAPISENPYLSLSFEKAQGIKEIDITLDSNLSVEIMPSLSKWHHVRQAYSVPDTILKDFTVEAFCGDESVFKKEIYDNYQRRVIINADVSCNKIVITPTATRGCENARICEVRIY